MRSEQRRRPVPGGGDRPGLPRGDVPGWANGGAKGSRHSLAVAPAPGTSA
ncbi:hypothetical protein LI90_3920 [Carbonactinospora thermoautotrophica]|uniref:Uncharacterized protein n=1 Tax=Carbonactinospora thermoautotrophica TaxID=1469144 RepID=A0A132MYH2_9ACTN|nr:hypothetical protein [Carbonactinospora thermoautotrophica]KWX02873.1 hypothetical protein LI90_3920 [Carbonactinospora thermoautotrophica]